MVVLAILKRIAAIIRHEIVEIADSDVDESSE